ncbi:hypothetical protein LX36DRAFT_728002 [Colletotrichum falcatum]|nr:hypothetical protein LX36DRAFT_728002 [Colletotrichum falcatum]
MNLFAPFLLVQQLLHKTVDTNCRNIVNIASLELFILHVSNIGYTDRKTGVPVFHKRSLQKIKHVDNTRAIRAT